VLFPEVASTSSASTGASTGALFFQSATERRSRHIPSPVLPLILIITIMETLAS